MHCGGAIADPEAVGRPGQAGSAGCGQSGAIAPGRRVDGGMDSRARQQLSGFLLRQGCHYGRSTWSKLHRRGLAGLKFEQAVHHIVLEDYIAAVEAAEARRDRLTAQIEAMLPDWTLAAVVAAALQTMRGMVLVNAATLVAELGDSRASPIRASSCPISGWCHWSIQAAPASDAAASPRPATARPAGC